MLIVDVDLGNESALISFLKDGSGRGQDATCCAKTIKLTLFRHVRNENRLSSQVHLNTSAHFRSGNPPALSPMADDAEVRAKMFNARLMLEGYAQLAASPPNVKYVDFFRQYQTEAREQNRVLWSLETY